MAHDLEPLADTVRRLRAQHKRKAKLDGGWIVHIFPGYALFEHPDITRSFEDGKDNLPQQRKHRSAKPRRSA